MNSQLFLKIFVMSPFRMQLEWVWLPPSSVKWLLTRSRILEGNYIQNTLEATQMLSSTVYQLDFWISSFSFFLYIILVFLAAYTSLPHFTNIHLFFFILKKCLRTYCAVSLRIYLYIGFYILLHLNKTIIHILYNCTYIKWLYHKHCSMRFYKRKIK